MFVSVLGDVTNKGKALVSTGVKLLVLSKPVTLAGNVDVSGGVVIPNPTHKLSVGGIPVACLGDPLTNGSVIAAVGAIKLITP